MGPASKDSGTRQEEGVLVFFADEAGIRSDNHDERRHTVEEICRLMGIGRSLRYNHLIAAERDALRTA